MGIFDFMKKKKDQAPQQSVSGPDLSVTPSLDLPDIKIEPSAPPTQGGPSDVPPGMEPPPQIDTGGRAMDAPPSMDVPSTPSMDMPKIDEPPKPKPDEMGEKYPLPPGQAPGSVDIKLDDIPPASPREDSESDLPGMPDDLPPQPESQEEPQEHLPVEEPMPKMPEADDLMPDKPDIPEDSEEPVQFADSEEPVNLASDEYPQAIPSMPESRVEEQPPKALEVEHDVEEEHMPEMPEPKQVVTTRLVDDSFFINVETFKSAAELINSLSEESRMAEEALLRVKDITLGKEKIFERWQSDLEQLERELIQLDKMLFNM